MFRRELLALSSIAIGLFFLVALLSSFAVHRAQDDGRALAEDILPGLISAGEAIDRLQDNWFTTSRLLTIPSPTKRDELIHLVLTNSTDGFWNDYDATVFDSRDRTNFNRLQQSRRLFLNHRAYFFATLKAGQDQKAAEFYQTQLTPAFKDYQASANNLFVSTATQGKQRAARVIRLSHWTPLALGGCAVLVLVVGIFIGFKATLGAFNGQWHHTSNPSKSPPR